MTPEDKIEAMVAGGLADNDDDARTMLVDMGEIEDADERPCGCPWEYHLADCDGTRSMSKDEYMEVYSRYDSMDDVPDEEGW